MAAKLPKSQHALALRPFTTIQIYIRSEPQQYSIQAQRVTSSMTLIDLSYYGHQDLETSYGQETHRYGLRDTVASIFTSGVSKEIEQ